MYFLILLYCDSQRFLMYAIPIHAKMGENASHSVMEAIFANVLRVSMVSSVKKVCTIKF